MFISVIVLRYTRKNVERKFRVPGGTIGMWIVATMGLLSSLFAIVIGFFPPEQINTGSETFFISFLAIGLIVACTIPFIILACKKESWLHPTS